MATTQDEQWVLVVPVAGDRAADSASGPTPAGAVRTVGLFSNNKQNAAEIEAAMGAELLEVFGVQTRTYMKLNASVPAEPELIDRMVSECDAIITGSGDCGSCTAGTVHDAVTLRARGVPTLMLGSTSFEGLARMQARSLDDPDIDLCVVAHPIGGLSPDDLEKRCRDAAGQAVDWMRGLLAAPEAAPTSARAS